MLYKEVIRLFGSFLLLYAGILLIPFIIAAYYQFFSSPALHPQLHSTTAFAYTILICLLGAGFCRWVTKNSTGILYRRESLVAVVLVWFITPAIGALPFSLSNTLERFDQAYFEATSGFTTTGASMLEPKLYHVETGEEIPIQKSYCGLKETHYNYFGTVKPVFNTLTGQSYEGIEAVGKALLFWRSFTQWLGGMGIIVLFVAFLPELGVKGKFLFQTETPGPLKDSFKPRITETALQLWEIYMGLTLLQIVFILFTNHEISIFDATTLSFSTVSTGGFSIHNQNVAFYNNASTEWIIILFMVLGSLNFSFYYYILKGKIYRLIEPESVVFITSLFLLGSIISLYLIGTDIISLKGVLEGTYSIHHSLRTGFFQLISAHTSSGFFTANIDTWPIITQALLLISMYLGGMSGSTAGGMKIIRVYLLAQLTIAKIESLFKPKSVKILRVGDREVDANVAISVLCFFVLIIAISILTTLLYLADHIDPETAIGLTVCMVNNTGLAFNASGPVGSFAFMSPFSTYLSAFVMILGRLEFYAVLVLLLPSFWKEK